jgi:hypothetical protein
MKLTYIGRRIVGKRLSHVYLKEDNTRLSFKSKISHEAIGYIIEVTETETGVKGPYTHVGKSNNPDLQKWYNTDRASYDEHLAFKESSKKITEDYAEAIAVLNKRYREVSYSQRQLFINRLIIEITK